MCTVRWRKCYQHEDDVVVSPKCTAGATGWLIHQFGEVSKTFVEVVIRVGGCVFRTPSPSGSPRGSPRPSPRPQTKREHGGGSETHLSVGYNKEPSPSSGKQDGSPGVSVFLLFVLLSNSLFTTAVS